MARNKTGALFNPSLARWRDAYDAANNTAEVKLEGGLFRFEHDFGPLSLVALTGYDQVH